jgi:hypothetical protein
VHTVDHADEGTTNYLKHATAVSGKRDVARPRWSEKEERESEKSLGSSVDEKERLVMKEAMHHCRESWFLISAIGDTGHAFLVCLRPDE